MTTRTWVGGHTFESHHFPNDARAPDNWSPTGSPQPGDYLTMVSGTMVVMANYNLAGDELHLTPPPGEYGTGPINLGIHNGGDLTVGGSAFLGDPVTIGVATKGNYLHADNLTAADGTVDISTNSDLVVTGNMTFSYFGHLKGDPATFIHGIDQWGTPGTITNNGTISIADGDISAHVDGHGTLEMHNYHDGWGAQTITGAIDGGQTLLLTPGTHGTRTELAHPDTFKASLKMATPSPLGSYPSLLDIDGIQASRMDIRGDMLRLYGDGNKPLWQVREHMAAGVGASMHDTPTGTEIAFGSPQQLVGY